MKPTKRLKIYISADLEGVNGVVLRDHVDPAKPEYRQAQRWMTSEVNSVINGVLAAGATQLVINDSHHHMSNLLIDELCPPATLVSGPVKPLSMMEGLDDSFDAALFIGYHAAFGTPKAVHDHTYAYSIVRRVSIDGRAAGEFGLNATLAGHFAVPVVMLSGDEAVCCEVHTWSKKIKTVAVKQAISRYAAICRPFTETLAELRSTAAAAVQEAKKITPIRTAQHPELQVEFLKAEQAECAVAVPDSTRIDAFTVGYRAADGLDLYRRFLLWFRLAKTCS
ncbi:MAG TPA: M55 family metallopeptidase [bacterium]|nr:M55 family metallopeptidase [bacterium]HPG45331.1 M55 family metallopeptidase [bacterium]HPM98950.1 M55 family metallopeptidase [bacterium]